MMENKQKDDLGFPVSKKTWEAPGLHLISQNAVHSGGVPGGVEGALTPHASPPFTSGSVYHS
ncbi:hypothetical protein ACFGVR_19725 [Mucilaginibacter sp. AW1-3]